MDRTKLGNAAAGMAAAGLIGITIAYPDLLGTDLSDVVGRNERAFIAVATPVFLIIALVLGIIWYVTANGENSQ